MVVIRVLEEVLSLIELVTKKSEILRLHVFEDEIMERQVTTTFAIEVSDNTKRRSRQCMHSNRVAAVEVHPYERF